MTFEPSNAISNSLPNDLIIPQDFEDANLILTDYFRSLVEALNDKEIAHFSTNETVTGQKFFTAGDANTFRGTFRKVVNFGTLPNTGSTSVAHGISTTENTVFTRIYATATDPGASTITQSIPIPFVDPLVLANGIELSIDATDVTITTAVDYSAFTTTLVILEFILDSP